MLRKDFEILISRFRPELLRLALRRLNHIEDAEDAAGTTVAIALSASQEVLNRSDRQIVAWIFKTFRNVVSNEYMRRKRCSPVTDFESADGEPSLLLDTLSASDSRDWIGAQLSHEARYRLRCAELSITQRRALTNRLSGMSRAESAKDLKMSQHGVRNALMRAVKLLKSVPIQTMPEIGTNEYLFWFCAKATVYRAPVSVGSGFSRDRLRRLS